MFEIDFFVIGVATGLRNRLDILVWNIGNSFSISSPSYIDFSLIYIGYNEHDKLGQFFYYSTLKNNNKYEYIFLIFQRRIL